MEINILGKLVVLSYKYIGDAQPWGQKYWKSHFKVTVQVYDSVEDKACRKAKFDFYQPNNDMNDDDLLDAMRCFMSDAMSGDMSFEEFRREFGYTSSLRAHNVLRSCQSAAKKLRELFPEETDLYEISECLDNIEL